MVVHGVDTEPTMWKIRLGYIAFLMSPFLYYYMTIKLPTLHIVKPFTEIQLWFWVAVVYAGVMFSILPFARRFFFEKPCAKSLVSFAEDFGGAFFVCWAMVFCFCGCIGVLGLALSYLGAEIEFAAPFLALSVIMHLVHRPTEKFMIEMISAHYAMAQKGEFASPQADRKAFLSLFKKKT